MTTVTINAPVSSAEPTVMVLIGIGELWPHSPWRRTLSAQSSLYVANPPTKGCMIPRRRPATPSRLGRSVVNKLSYGDQMKS